jgi:hypothetical protein
MFPPPPPVMQSKKKCPEIPRLPDYQLPPSPDFWKTFPTQRLPSHPSSSINYIRLGAIIKQHRSLLSMGQCLRADRVVHDLQYGSDVKFQKNLPSARISNTPSVFVHGEEFSDTLAWWVRQGYVAGPFTAPPFRDLRTNAMMAVAQRNKIRIIMNLSAPEGDSYNDAIDELALEKVVMSSARLFGYSIMDCGRHARMWKFDMGDAYKTIPSAQSDLRLQGFFWLGKFFIELKKVFGSKETVSAYDRLNNTLVSVAAASAGLSKQLIHRTLDDVPVVTPASSEAGPVFAEVYSGICAQIGASLAPQCPNLEKAFSDSTQGTVLGIRFDTDSLTWSISKEKKFKILDRIRGPIMGHHIGLNDLQKLIGSLNDVGQMCPFLRGFRQPLHSFLVSFKDAKEVMLPAPPEVKKDLRIWAVAMDTAAAGLPIPSRPSHHLPSAIVFVSDASGAQFNKCQGRFVTIPFDGERGAASINAIEKDDLWFYASVTFSKSFLLEARDSSDHAYGCKSSTLEAIGLILPFLGCPALLIGREVSLLTDNEALVHGWPKRRVPHDTSVSIFLRALHMIAAFLGASVEVRHLPRVSTPSAELADALTRSTTTLECHRQTVSSAPPVRIPQALYDWLQSPNEDWNLSYELLSQVQAQF